MLIWPKKFEWFHLLFECPMHSCICSQGAVFNHFRIDPFVCSCLDEPCFMWSKYTLFTEGVGGGGARINIGHWLGVWSCWVNLCVKCLWFQHKQLTTLLQWMAFTLFCVLILPFCETIELYRNGIVVFQSMLLSEKAILRHIIWSLSWASES